MSKKRKPYNAPAERAHTHAPNIYSSTTPTVSMYFSFRPRFHRPTEPTKPTSSSSSPRPRPPPPPPAAAAAAAAVEAFKERKAASPCVFATAPAAAMVISAELPAPLPPPDPVADGAAAAAAAVEEAMSGARQGAGALSSFPSSLKTWGSHRVLRCAPVNRAGDAIAAARRSSPEQLDEVRERLLLHLREVAAPANDAADDAAASRPWKLRTRRRRHVMAPAAAAATATAPSPPSERRAARARAEALDRPRFSVTLSSEEIEEDVYAVTGARPRRRPRRRPRPVQKQLDLLFPGAWLSEITAESYRVPDDR